MRSEDASQKVKPSRTLSLSASALALCRQGRHTFSGPSRWRWGEQESLHVLATWQPRYIEEETKYEVHSPCIDRHLTDFELSGARR